METIRKAIAITTEFAKLTGLDPASLQPKRYLWTDAFAVCNFIDLYKTTEERKYIDLASQLVDQVHNSLGKHRLDDKRKDWISGLKDCDGVNHPTIAHWQTQE